jgi:hypothetical protein
MLGDYMKKIKICKFFYGIFFISYNTKTNYVKESLL